MNKKRLVGTVIGLAMVVAPALADAQATQDPRTALITLFQQIVALQTQLIQTLQQQIAALHLPSQTAGSTSHLCPIINPPICTTTISVTRDGYNCPTAFQCAASGTSTGYSLSAPATIVAGEPFSVTWSYVNVAAPFSYDWVTVVKRGMHAPPQGPFAYTDGLGFGSKSLIAPALVGAFDVVLYQNDGYTELARIPITVSTSAAQVILVPNSRTLHIGEVLRVRWLSTLASRAYDWVALVPTGQVWEIGDPWFYVDGRASGRKKMPPVTQAGTYDLVYYQSDDDTLENSFELARKSGYVTVTATAVDGEQSSSDSYLNGEF